MESSDEYVEPTDQQYHWYVLGCAHFGWLPLMKTDFLRQYERLHRCDRVELAYREKSGDTAFWKAQGFSESLRLSDMLKNIKQEINRLCGLDRAVLMGKRLDGDEGASVGARLQPVPPILMGTVANPLPYQDTESDGRASRPE